MQNLSAFIGVYKQDEQNTWNFFLESEQLCFKASDGKVFKLKPNGENTFLIEGTQNNIQFILNASNVPHSVKININAKEVIAVRVHLSDIESKLYSETFKDLIKAGLIFVGIISLIFFSAPITDKLCKNGLDVACKLSTIVSIKSKDRKATNLYIDKSNEINDSEKTKQHKEQCEMDSSVDCNELAHIYKNISALDKAKFYYNKSCDLKDQDGCIYYSRVLATQGSFQKELDFLQERCSKQTPKICYVFANHLSKKGNITKAKNYFAKACSSSPKFGCYELGVFNLDNGDFQKAKMFFQSACKETLGNSCKFYNDLKNLDEHILKCVNRKDSDSCFKSADIFDNFKKSEKSLSYYSKACQLGNSTSCSIYSKRIRVRNLRNRNKQK